MTARGANPNDLYDYVLVVVRKNQVADLLPVLAQNRSPNIIFMTNNLSGPEELTRILGKDRVMMDFVLGAGKRDGGVIRAISRIGGSWISTPFGETDGKITPRLTRLIGILCQAGLSAKASTDISNYLTEKEDLVPDEFRLLPAEEQANTIQTCAAKLGRRPEHLEKDVWCWVLQNLFGMAQCLPKAFEGGTSLF